MQIMVMIIAKTEMNNNLHGNGTDLKCTHDFNSSSLFLFENKSHDQIPERDYVWYVKPR